MKQTLQNIANNWQLDAVQEDVDKYFYNYEEVNSVLSGKNCYVIGRKGSGKTAICQHILRQKNFNIFTDSLSFKNFPFNELYTHEDNNFRKPNQYITFWKYLIYIYICKLMSDNETLDSSFRAAIKDVIPKTNAAQLPREIRRWTGFEFGAQLAEKLGGLSIKIDTALYKNDITWVERTNIFEDLILHYCDKSEYYIVFDELDEDYSNASDAENESYISLLKGLFKAVQSVKSVLKGSNLNVKPIIFLRDDIYAQIKDSDKNKWSDFKLELSWTPAKLKELLAYRISRENEQIGLSFELAWNTVFKKNLYIHCGGNGRKTKPAFEYILDNTHLRPRDIISYIKCCCTNALQYNCTEVDWRDVKAADREFSNYFRDELEDEISPLIPEIDKVWNIITEMRKLIFSEQEFVKVYNDYVKRQLIKPGSPSQVLETLFNFSVLGNQHKTQEKIYFFRYQQTNMTFNRREMLVVHRGLLKSLQLI